MLVPLSCLKILNQEVHAIKKNTNNQRVLKHHICNICNLHILCVTIGNINSVEGQYRSGTAKGQMQIE